jgi:hypothetical protein
MVARSAIVVVGVLASPLPLAAQTASVAVRGAGNPLAGALVTVFDSSGKVTQRELTDRSGHLLIRLPTVGTFVVKVDGIGFHGAERTERFGLNEVSLDFNLDSRPYRLNDLRVISSESAPCRQNPSKDSAMADVWADVEKALRSEILSRTRSVAQTSGVLIDRKIDLSHSIVEENRTEVRANRPSPCGRLISSFSLAGRGLPRGLCSFESMDSSQRWSV